MMQVGNGAAVAAVFEDRTRAKECLDELRRSGFPTPWLATTEAVASDAHHRIGETANSPDHDVDAASDGFLGSIGRFFSGERSLQRSLVDHGLGETSAREVDAQIPAGGAVVVVASDGRADAAAAIFAAFGGTTHGTPAQPVGVDSKRSHADGTVAGQGDELDRGTGRNASGGAGTGASRDRPREPHEQGDRPRESRDFGDDVFYERPTASGSLP